MRRQLGVHGTPGPPQVLSYLSAVETVESRHQSHELTSHEQLQEVGDSPCFEIREDGDKNTEREKHRSWEGIIQRQGSARAGPTKAGE